MSNLVLVAQSSQGGGMSMIIMMVAIFAIMWFFMIKPYGTVKSIDLAKNTVDVKIAKDVVVTVDKSYVFKDPASTTAVQK